MAKVDLYSKDWCELVFANRNKAYGAYVLRKEVGQRNAKALIAVAIGIVAILVIVVLKNTVFSRKVDTSVTTVTQLAKLEEAKVKDKAIIKKVEPKRVEPQRIKSSIKFTAPKITKDEEVSEDDEMNIADIKEVITSKPDEESKIYDFVEQQPTFPGGEEALLKYITDHLKYPSVSAENGTQGRCVVRFVVTETGEIGDVQLLSHVDTYCDREAIRVIKSLPKFSPGRQQGKPVKVWFQVPVIFELM